MMNMQTLISFDSANGTGKTTVVSALQQHLVTCRGVRAMSIKRPLPGGVAAAKILELYAKGERGSPECERLMEADAYEIREMLSKEDVEVAILDRDWFSQVIYGCGDFERLRSMYTMPDVSVFLWAHPMTCLRRIAARKKYAPGIIEPGCTLKECRENDEKYLALRALMVEGARKEGKLFLEYNTTLLDPIAIARRIAHEVLG